MRKSTVQSWKDFLDEETAEAKGHPRIRQGGLFTTQQWRGELQKESRWIQIVFALQILRSSPPPRQGLNIPVSWSSL